MAIGRRLLLLVCVGVGLAGLAPAQPVDPALFDGMRAVGQVYLEFGEETEAFSKVCARQGCRSATDGSSDSLGRNETATTTGRPLRSQYGVGSQDRSSRKLVRFGWLSRPGLASALTKSSLRSAREEWERCIGPGTTG
jgi:hypothetical protein